MAIHILNIMFYSNTNLSINIEYLKLGYIFKRYHYIKSDVIVKIFDILKSIQKYLNISSYLSFEYFYSLFNNQILKNFESYKSLEIPEIRRKNELEIDSIDIIEFQDTFGLFYEHIIRNNLEINEYELKDFDELFESELANIRSNKLFGLPNRNINGYDNMYDKKECSTQILLSYQLLMTNKKPTCPTCQDFAFAFSKLFPLYFSNRRITAILLQACS